MKKIMLLLCSFTFSLIGHAQLTNDSATIVISPGATLYIDMDLNNLNNSDILNEGTLEVNGQFNNELGSVFTSTLTAVSIFHGEQMMGAFTSHQDRLNKLHTGQNSANDRKVDKQIEIPKSKPQKK